MLVDATPYGSIYQFSFGDEDAPQIDNFVPQKLELEFGDEFKAIARDSRGVIQAMVVSRPEARQITAKVTGYILEGFTPPQIARSFNFEGRFYICRGISNPRLVGGFNIVTITAESHFELTAISDG